MSAKQPLISVIVPVYNTEKYLSKCLDSILKQEYQNLEIILVDDGSADRSGDIIDEYQRKDNRVVTIHKTNGGQSAARNLGICLAKGEYVCFVDSDDEIDTQYVSLMVNELKDDERVLPVGGIHFRKLKLHTENDAYTNPVRAQKPNERLEKYVTYLLTVDGRMYSSINKLFNLSILKEHQITFDEGRNFAEDTKFVLDYISAAQPRIACIPKAIYTYNFGSEASTIRKSGVIWANWLASYEDLKKFVGPKPTFAEKYWLKVVLARWRISWLRNQRRAKQ